MQLLHDRAICGGTVKTLAAVLLVLRASTFAQTCKCTAQTQCCGGGCCQPLAGSYCCTAPGVGNASGTCCSPPSYCCADGSCATTCVAVPPSPARGPATIFGLFGSATLVASIGGCVLVVGFAACCLRQQGKRGGGVHSQTGVHAPPPRKLQSLNLQSLVLPPSVPYPR